MLISFSTHSWRNPPTKILLILPILGLKKLDEATDLYLDLLLSPQQLYQTSAYEGACMYHVPQEIV